MVEVILLERVGRLGVIGDVVKVKPGYARNFLLPQKKALRATANNKKLFDVQRAQIETKNLELKTQAEAMAINLDGQTFTIIRQAGESGQLYGSVSTRDIADCANEAGFKIDRIQVLLNAPIKTIGVHTVKVKLHPAVEIEVKVNVARTVDEAERQAKGEDVVAARLAEERAQVQAQAAEIAENAVELDGRE
ncbi:MAG: large subunit ribosomal protein L9 [Hyphomonadaceae bacterium]|nr:MAG: large subunit ribosomal protein L9 [Hyphomonadaceae bacterium]